MAVPTHLPLDIIEIILSKLSVKPLHRFKSVSKSWNAIISDPVFVENHIRRSKYSNLFLHPVRSTSSSSRFSIVKLEGTKFQTLQVMEAPFVCRSELCFCDGVLLLTNPRAYRRKLVLWNPSTRLAAELWHRSCCSDAAFGLCRDPNTDDFMVVAAGRDHYSVYSCKNKSWIVMKKEYEIQYSSLGRMTAKSPGVCVDGPSYWVWTHLDIWNISRQILYYDPRDDKFKILRKPENLDDKTWIYLVNLRGSLCLYWGDAHKTRIWTKENGIDNNSWKECVTVEHNRISIPSWSRLHPIWLMENKIVLRIDYDRLVLYNPYENKFEEFDEDTQLGVFGQPYMESLYFPIEKSRPKRKCRRKCFAI